MTGFLPDSLVLQLARNVSKPTEHRGRGAGGTPWEQWWKQKERKKNRTAKNKTFKTQRCERASLKPSLG